MTRFLLPLLASLLAIAAAPANAELRLVDLTADFAAVHDATEGKEDAARIAAFRARLDPKLPGFYTGQRATAKYDARILKALDAWPQDRAGVEEVSRRFAEMFAPALARFETALWPFRDDAPIYLIHSFGEMDGGTRGLTEGVRLIFGADMIARLHMDHDIQPFFIHELFHLAHGPAFPECGEVWCALWTEGLATYAAKTLDPGATDAELLLTQPKPIRPAVEADRAKAVCAVVRRLDSSDEADMNALFSFSETDGLPARFGYYVGYLAAAEAGRDHDLKTLARMPPAEARPLLERSLQALATC